jgi:branched-chain amino acid transport system permease protein
VLAAIAGSLYAHYVRCINPSSFNLMWSIRFMLMAMVGGMQSLWGALVGTILMTFVGNEWLRMFAEYEILVYGTILLAVALFLPGGIVSLASTIARRREKRASALEDAGS